MEGLTRVTGGEDRVGVVVESGVVVEHEDEDEEVRDGTEANPVMVTRGFVIGAGRVTRGVGRGAESESGGIMTSEIGIIEIIVMIGGREMGIHGTGHGRVKIRWSRERGRAPSPPHTTTTTALALTARACKMVYSRGTPTVRG